MDSKTEKIQKFVANAGICSRRKCEDLVREGKIKINDRKAKIGDRVSKNDKIYYRGKLICADQEMAYYVFYKPRGVISSMTSRQGKSIKDFITDIPGKVYPVGRLDKESEGLILLTNDGEWANKIMHPSQSHEKEYIVRTNDPIDREILEDFKRGIRVDGVKLRPVRSKNIEKNQVNLILKQGINRQIRKMFEKYGLEIVYLKRIRVDKYKLGNLNPGKYKKVTK